MSSKSTLPPVTNPSRVFRIIACPNNEFQSTTNVHVHTLCISPVFKGYIEEPDTTPPAVKRNGEGSLTLNNEKEVVEVVLEYLNQTHSGNDFKLRSSDHDVVFLVKLYKLALSLG